MTPYLVTIKANSSTFCTHFLPFKFVVKGLKVMYSFSKFIFVLCKCLGVAPVKLVNGQYVFSYVIFFYNVVFLTFQICIGLHALLSDYKSTFRGKSVRMKTRTAIVVTFLELFLSMIVIASGILGAAVNYKKILEIGSMLKRVDEELRTRWNFRKFTLLLCGILIHHVLLIYVDTYFWFSLTPDSWSYTVCYVYSFVEIAIEAQFALIAWSIKCRFQKINDSLAENLSYKYFTKFKRPFRLKQHLSFEMFQELHWSLCEAIQIVNNAFGWQLLTSVLCICVHIIVTPYFLLLDLFYPAAYGSADIGFLILQVAWIVTHHMHLLLIVIPASETTVQAKKASIILSENLNCLVPATDILKLESFVLQLKAQSVKFSACGLFNLQRPVITSLIGSVVTYLVILIQFQNSDKVYH